MSATKSGIDMRAEALRLAETGFRVFPLSGKIPIGGRGCRDASNDPLQIESWWEQHPKANIGIAGGHGIAILDIDDRPDKNREGIAALKSLARGRAWPKTVAARSGGGGRHFYFGVTKDMGDVPNTKDKLGKGIEVIYDGRYVVAPPSLHPISKRRYEWVRDPVGSPCAAMPAWLLEMNAELGSRNSLNVDDYTEPVKAGEGRNNYLTSMAGSLRRQRFSRSELRASLLAVNESRCDPPLPEREVLRIADSVSRYQPEHPMILAKRTDLGNGERFASHAKDHAIYVPGLGWHTWSGKRWRPDEGQVQEIAKQVTREIFAAAQDISQQRPKASEELYKWAISSSSMGRIDSMTRSASTQPEIYTEVSKLDNDTYRLNMLNGCLDLRKGELHPHDAGMMLTKLARVTYDPEAECPKWNKFLEDILPHEDVRNYLQRAVGYSLCGDTREQCFFLMYGTGSNGKSTFIETLRYMLGHYGIKIATSTIMGSSAGNERATPDLVRLRGPRFAVAAESGDGSAINEAVIKDLTGEDTITARALYKSPIEFVPQLKLWVYSNYKPTVHGMDHGIWRRIRLIPFTAVIEKPNKKLRLQLRSELAGIFNWAYRGYLEWEKFGLAEPTAITDEVQEYREAMDSVKQFIQDTCHLGESEVESAAELWEHFSAWQKDLPYQERMRRNTFYGRLRDEGFKRAKSRVHGSKHQTSCFKGLRLADLG